MTSFAVKIKYDAGLSLAYLYNLSWIGQGAQVSERFVESQ